MASRREPRIASRIHEAKLILLKIEMALTENWVAFLLGLSLFVLYPLSPSSIGYLIDYFASSTDRSRLISG